MVLGGRWAKVYGHGRRAIVLAGGPRRSAQSRLRASRRRREDEDAHEAAGRPTTRVGVGRHRRRSIAPAGRQVGLADARRGRTRPTPTTPAPRVGAARARRSRPPARHRDGAPGRAESTTTSPVAPGLGDRRSAWERGSDGTTIAGAPAPAPTARHARGSSAPERSACAPPDEEADDRAEDDADEVGRRPPAVHGPERDAHHEDGDHAAAPGGGDGAAALVP